MPAEPDWITPSITALAGIFGVVAGGVLSFWTSRRVAKEQWKMEQVSSEAVRKEEIYRNYLAEVRTITARAVNKAGEGTLSDFITLSQLLAGIHIGSSTEVLGAAKAVFSNAMDLHQVAHRQNSNIDAREAAAQAVAKSVDSFVTVVREELRTIRNSSPA